MSEWGDQRCAAFRRIMKARFGLKGAAAIARATGVRPTTLRSYFDRKTDALSARTEHTIARALGVSVDALYGEDYGPVKPARRVWVKGYVGAGNAVELFEAMGEREGFYEVARPFGADPDLELFAMEIRGGSMPPFRDGDVIYCEQHETLDAARILGEPCVVETIDGRILFKDVRRGYEPGTFNLLSWDGGPPLENERLKRAMPFVSVVRKGRVNL